MGQLYPGSGFTDQGFPMTDHKQIYARQADLYEQLVAHEDYQHNIETALRAITPLEGIDVVELGAGTGRLTCLLTPLVRSLRAFDISPHMLAVALKKLEPAGLHNWSLGVADHRNLPVPAASADVVLSGWSVCYLVDWNRSAWQAEVEQALAEMQRAARPGGVLILLETQGTGFETPHPPEHLEAYYRLLGKNGFEFTWIRTDYCFDNLEQTVELARFFFGEALALEVKSRASLILPECTGFWWKYM
jgi:ubiquinone/menaquinone biosynthesis C-methylase UbiE